MFVFFFKEFVFSCHRLYKAKCFYHFLLIVQYQNNYFVI